MNLSLTASSTGAQTVLDVQGEVDVQSAAQLTDRLVQILDSGQRSVVVDLSRLSFLDSTGLGALVAARNRAQQTGARLSLVCASERMLKLFRITGLDAVFEIYATLAAGDLDRVRNRKVPLSAPLQGSHAAGSRPLSAATRARRAVAGSASTGQSLRAGRHSRPLDCAAAAPMETPPPSS